MRNEPPCVASFLDVEQLQSLAAQDALHGVQPQVGEMLVVDGVELRLLHQLQQVRELQCQCAVRRQHLAQPGHEVVDVRHVGQYVVAQHQIAAAALCHEAAREVQPEEFAYRLDAAAARHARRAFGGFDTDAGNLALLQVLQQVTVVRCHLP